MTPEQREALNKVKALQIKAEAFDQLATICYDDKTTLAEIRRFVRKARLDIIRLENA